MDTPETDTRFPERIAQQAAYFGCTSDRAIEVGKDGAQYILDKYGIGIIDFQAQAVVWTRSGNYSSMITYQMEEKEDYLKQFQNEMGGTIADDIEF